MSGATWIWYPGDFEIWLHWQVSLRREERGTPYPPFWRLDTFYGCVTFRKQFVLLLDFGKETFGYLQLHDVYGQGTIAIYYGESVEEALSPETCVQYCRAAIS